LVCGLGTCAESANLGMVCEEPAPALYVKRSSEPAYLSVSTPLLCSRRFGGVVRGWVMTGGLFTSREEEESDDGFEHALVFFYGCSVSAAFLAEHAPCLEVCDGVLDSRPDFA
jgi:hypothetical protein